MTLWQTSGFVESLLCLGGLDWAVPGFSTLSRRQKTLAINIPYHGSKGPLHLLIDKDTLEVRAVEIIGSNGLSVPKLGIGDRAMEFWAAREENHRGTRQQRCWGHKSGNVPNYLPKRTQPKAKKMLHDIW